MIEKAYENALLASAAYVDWDQPFHDIESDLVGGAGFSQEQFESMFGQSNGKYEVYNGHSVGFVKHINGFSATIFENRSTGELTVAFRGTDNLINDPVTTILSVFTMPGSAPSSINALFGQQNSISTFLQQAGLDVGGTLVKPVNFTGHSLGGFLSSMATYRYHASMGEAFTYNGLGTYIWDAVGDHIYDRIAQSGKMNNYYADFIGAFIGRHPGEKTKVFVEAYVDGTGHSIAKMVESLSVYRVLAALAPELGNRFGMDASYNMLAGASNEPFESLDTVIDQLGDFLGGNATLQSVKDDVELFYQEVISRGVTHAATDLSQIDLAALAGRDTTAGRGLRYAAENLNSFAFTTNLASTAADDPEFDLNDARGQRQYSGQYLADRAQLLKAVLQRNSSDSGFPSAIAGEKVYFHDVDEGEFFAGAIGLNGNSITDRADVRNVLFGNQNGDTLFGQQHDDHLYGLAGQDLLLGEEGNDHLEGGAGIDHLIGGPGNDFLTGGASPDVFEWSTGDGHDLIGDYDDGGDSIVINGTDVSTMQFTQVAPGASIYREASNPGITAHYDGSFLALHIGSGGNGGSITATQYSPVTGQDYGLVLNQAPVPAPITQFTVTGLGNGPGQIYESAYRRQLTLQGGHDWSTISLRFNASSVANYAGNQSSYGLLSPAFEGGPLEDYLTGDSGSNQLTGLAGNDVIEGGDGADYLAGFGGSDHILGGEGNDILFGAGRFNLADALQSGTAHDRFYLGELMEASGDVNVLSGGLGNDMLSGGAHGDTLSGGPGADYLFGGAGADILEGGAENDVIYGDSALAVTFSAGPNQAMTGALEIAFASSGNDDTIYAGPGNDTVWGEAGADEIHGGDGDDSLIGDRFNDTAYYMNELPAYGATSPVLGAAEHGNDRLFGGAGSDLLSGLGGDDYLEGGFGQDRLYGGEGDDTYATSRGDGIDYVEDTIGTHTLVFSDASVSDLQVLFQSGNVTVRNDAADEGFQFSGAQWARTRIALNSAQTLVERSRLATHYLNDNGEVLISVNGSDAFTETERDEMFSVEESTDGQPSITFGRNVTEVDITRREGDGGATVTFPGAVNNPIIQLSPVLLALGWEFLEPLENVSVRITGFRDGPVGTAGDDTVTGTASADQLSGFGGSDLLRGEEGNDELDGGRGDDLLQGGPGDDSLYGGIGHDNDILEGGSGNDTMDGAFANDIYRFALGDGQDVIADAQGTNSFEFDSSVAAGDVALYYTARDHNSFRLQYSDHDWVQSLGVTDVRSIAGLRVDGFSIPLVQRSDLTDGAFYDTRLNDVYETQAGDDVIYAGGRGNDVIRLAGGDGNDRVELDEGYYPEVISEIRLVDDEDIGFSFSGIDATISYAGGTLTLEAEKHFSTEVRDNALNRFTLSSEVSPHWVPRIVAAGPGWLSGSFGSDHLIGSQDFDVITPGYGNDLIESGSGNDSIFLNDVYFNVAQASIGAKTIVPGPGDDLIETPLYQGMTLAYDRGDGHDRVRYDWSYGELHPYQFSLLQGNSQPAFTAHGEDTLAFGPGIDVDDLLFVRSENTLQLVMADQSGSITFENFFNVYDPASVSGRSGLLDPFSGQEEVSYRLSTADIEALFPRSPIKQVSFADGSVQSMEALLADSLVTDGLTLSGTDGDDVMESASAGQTLLAGAGDDVIFDEWGATIYAGAGQDHVTVNGGALISAEEGDDSVALFGDDNTLVAGPGNDFAETAGNNSLDMGPGNDEVKQVGGNNRLDAGTGRDLVTHLGGTLTMVYGRESGTDTIGYVPGDAVLQIEMDETVVASDVSFRVAEGDEGSTLNIVIEGVDSELQVVPLSYNPVFNEYEPEVEEFDADIRFVNGGRLAGHEVLAIALGSGTQGREFIGTPGRDRLVGTDDDDYFEGFAGNDRLQGKGGDDRFVMSGLDNGFDRVRGGAGQDTILGSDGDDNIGLQRLVKADGIERIDARAGEDVIRGNAGNNKLDFSKTELTGVERIDAGPGNDRLTGSHGDDVLLGGRGNDKLIGLGGDDRFEFTAGDGADVLLNRDASPDSVDSLSLLNLQFDQLWFSRRKKHLVIDVIGSPDQVRINNWYAADRHKLDMISTENHTLYANQVDSLVNAMAAFDVPRGSVATTVQDTSDTLQPLLTSVWQVNA